VRRRTTPAHPDHALFIAAFDAAFLSATGGRPTWGGKAGAIVSRLLKAHGYAELERRMRCMFAWPQGEWPVTCPPSLTMLAQHIDTFVALPAPKRGADKGLSADEIMQGALELERRGL
jgi:hypothetical protein